MARRLKLREVELHHRHVVVGKPLPQVPSAPWVQLDGDHLSASGHELGGDCSVTGTEVKNELARADVGVLDDPGRPLLNEAMPGPTSSRLRGGGHDEPSVRRRTWTQRYAGTAWYSNVFCAGP